MVNLQDVKTDSWQIGVSKLTGLKIKEIHGFVTWNRDNVYLEITSIEFEDGQEVGIDGMHEAAYLTPYAKYNVPNLDDETLADLLRQRRIEDGEFDEDADD